MNLYDNSPSKALCIIGNGFDLHHNLETSYSYFRKYLIDSGRRQYVDQLESFFHAVKKDENGKYTFLLWSDLEEAIGRYDLKELFYNLTDWIQIDTDHMMRSAAQIEDSPNVFLAPLMDRLPALMEEWIGSIDVTRVSPDIALPSPVSFLSFNYTRVLEDVYHIPNECILHIHGIVGGGEELVVGHQTEADESDAFDESAPIYQEESMRNIIDIMNARRKPTKEIIARNKSFFESLHNITDIYVYGHSCSSVDIDYYYKIRESVREDIIWHLGCHNDIARYNAEWMMNELKMLKENWDIFSF